MKAPTQHNEGRESASLVRPRPPLLPEQFAVGIAAAAMLALLETVRAATGELGSRSPGDVLVGAGSHAVAFYLPAGAIAGLAMGLLIALLRASPALAPLRGRASPHLWFAPAPRLTATLLAWLAFAAIVALGARASYEYLATVAHRVDLAAWTMAGAALVLSGLAFLAATLARVVLTPVASRLGRAASPGVVIIAVLALTVSGAARWLQAHPEMLAAYGAVLLLVPAAPITYLACALVGRSVLRRAGRRATVITAGALVAVMLGAWIASALTYGHSNAVRTLVEEETLGGRWLLRRYMRVTDLDGDRHSWGFGGRDCNDFDPRIHPGTLDEPGDGIDLDCFAGDGAPMVALPGDGGFGARPASLPPRPNILLVTIDALRPDHLGIEGYERDTSPNIDAFARTAVRFREAIAPSSRSIRSIPAMFTGLYPSQIAYGDEYLYPALLPENTTIAESLRDDGYQTAVTMGTDYFHRVGGFYQGFEQIDEVLEYKPPRMQTADRALVQLERLATSGLPFFHWIHLFHVHRPYLDPPYPSRYGPEPIDGYDTEIRLADEQLQRILTALTRLGRAEDTIVILASDHGEAFGEHGRTGHASTLYEEELDAVLMIRIPGVESRRIDATVSLIDVAPTVLNLAGIDPPHPMPAQSLVPLITGEREPDRERWFFGELLPDGMFPFDIKMIRRGWRKLHWWVREGTIQLFDLEHDPTEQRDLSDERPDEAHELLGTLQAWAARSSRAQHQNETFIYRHLLREPPARMTHPLGLRYPGLFTVLGCDIPETRVAAGGTLDVTCYYQVEGETDLDLFFRVMIEGPRGYPLLRDMHALHYPLHGRYHTNQWRAGEIIRDPTPIPIPSQARTPGDLWLTFSVEDRGSRLLSYEQHGRPGTTARVTSILVHAPFGRDADAGVPRDASPTGE